MEPRPKAVFDRTATSDRRFRFLDEPGSERFPGSFCPFDIRVPPVVIVADQAWRRMVPDVEARAARAASIAGCVGVVVLDSDRAVQRLNARHRGCNKPTNVLTFESGDVVLASGVVRREALAAGRRPGDVLAHMIVHGALHLQGEDHGGAGAARRMERLETRLLHRIGVPNPWR